MPFIKQRTGRLDDEDYFLTGSFTDFLGGGVCSRKEGYFEVSQGEIKRVFRQEEFSAVVELLPCGVEIGQCFFFVETNRRKVGIGKECQETGEKWRITLSEGFLQVFSCAEGVWENIGGEPLEAGEAVEYMGFAVLEGGRLRFSSCRVYISPFLQLFNFPESFQVELHAIEGGLLKSEPFDSQMRARVVMDEMDGANIRILNLVGGVQYEQTLHDVCPGDDYIYQEKVLELIKGEEVLTYGPNTLDDNLIQLLKLRNPTPEDIDVVTLKIEGKDHALAKLSKDGANFDNSIEISDLRAGTEVLFYVKIEKSADLIDFEIKSF